jgi:integrase
MACIRKRRGKYVVDYRDSAGIRRWMTCDTRRQAQNVLSDKLREARQPTEPVVDPDVTITVYGARWLALTGASVKTRTIEGYTDTLERYIKPVLGAMKVRRLARGQVKTFLADKLGLGLSRNTVRIIHATLRAMLNAAVDDGVILANPADRLGRQFRLAVRAGERRERIKAFTREQLIVFFSKAATEVPRYAPLFFTMARAGVRLGEGLALQWDDLEFVAREIRVARAFSKRRLETPKSGHGRTVDMSQQLARTLKRLQHDRKVEKVERGWRDMPAWIFCTTKGTPLDVSNVEHAFKRALRAAKLPEHFSPHCLRHTFASLLLRQGESPAYVQRQLGHASIQLTVDTYGRWLPMSRG